jgi:Protein of unknown function (DUF3667)
MRRIEAPEPPPTACANCGQAFEAPPPNFCPRCGQESRVRAPRLMEFVQQFGGAYFSTEGALWRTIRLLLFKPGELTQRYLAGQRKHYVLPLRLYLTVSLLALIILRTVAGLSINLGAGFEGLDLRKGEYSIIQFGDGSGVGLKDGVFFCKNMPQWLCTRVQRRLDVDPQGLKREAQALSERFVSNLGAAMFVMVPLFALWLKLLYWNRRLRYTEHLVFALHLHTFWFVALLLTLPDQPILAFVALCAVPVYGFMALRRVYGGGLGWRLARVSVISLLYLVVLLLVLTFVGLWSLLF